MEPIYIPNYVSKDTADREFERLWNTLDWEKRDGAPRLEYWQNNYGLAYTYGRGTGERTYDCRPWDDFLLDEMHRMNGDFGFKLDCCFVNGYKDEKDSLGFHADDSPEMSPEQPVISFSLGAERVIAWRNNETREISSRLLQHGSLFIMPPGFQQSYQHKIPKGDRPMGPRVSATYRGLII
jgi:alkylated DNA repair dioxygenase AlkB